MSVLGSACRVSGLAIVLGYVAGCGGGGSGTPEGGTDNNSEPQTGVFLDSPTEGLRYVTPKLSGKTDERGTFQFYPGEKVEFFIGDMPLGSSDGKEVVTPFDFINKDVSQDYPVNVMRLLQSVDSDGNPENGINIDDNTATQLSGYANAFSFDISVEDFGKQKSLTEFMSESGMTLKDELSAVQHYQTQMSQYNSDNGFSVDVESIKGQGYIGRYGDFKVYEVISDLPDDYQELAPFSETAANVYVDLLTNSLKLTPASVSVVTALPQMISILQTLGVYPTAEFGFVASKSGDSLVSKIETDDRVFPVILIQTGNGFFTNPGNVKISVKGTTSDYISPLDASPLGATIWDLPIEGYHHNDRLSFLSESVPFAYAESDQFESGLISGLQKNKLYMLIPTNINFDGLHDNPSTVKAPFSERLIADLSGDLVSTYVADEGISFDDAGRYFFNLSLDGLNNLLVDDSLVSVDIAESVNTGDVKEGSIYSEDFSNDPSYTSLAPQYAYWDSTQGNYYVRTRDDLNAQYWAHSEFIWNIDPRIQDIDLSFDVMIENQDWGTYPMIGFFSDLPASIDDPSRVFYLQNSNADNNRERFRTCVILDADNACLMSDQYSVDNGVWYKVKFRFREQGTKVYWDVVERDSDTVIASQSMTVPPIGVFNHLGIGYYNRPNYGDEWAPIRMDDVNIIGY